MMNITIYKKNLKKVKRINKTQNNNLKKFNKNLMKIKKNSMI